jgi:SAM-dependent methyltransferase
MNEDVTKALFLSRVAEGLRLWIPPQSPHFEQTLQFALGRLDEGRQLSRFFDVRSGDDGFLRVLDLGSGNGGVALGVAETPRFKVTTADILIHQDLVFLRKELRLPIEQTVGVGEALPFADDTFHIVLCLDTIEHVPDPNGMAREIMRVLKPGGTCMLTTPARLRYLFAPDPHYGIRNLLLLPDRMQAWVATRLLRRIDEYEVTHIYWRVKEITRLFPEPHRVEVLWNAPRPFRRSILNRIWWLARNALWDRILIHKPTESGSASHRVEAGDDPKR